MDKLKALAYFVTAVEEGSFAGAARRLEISVPAVQKLVGALEASLKITLLERGARGVRLTPAGNEYVDRCRPLLIELEELGQIERSLQGAVERLSGTLTVAAHPQLVHQVLLPALPRFHARHPELEIDLRTVHRLSDGDAQTADVLLLHGWPEIPPDYVHRNLGATQARVFASPQYWADHGVPRHPSELSRHVCLTIRNPAGIMLDLWEFVAGEQRVQVPVRGWFSSNAREAVMDLVIGGHGVGRFNLVTSRDYVQSGRLVPALLDWEVQGGPPVNLLYKGSARRQPRVQAFIEHALQCLREHQERDELPLPVSTDRPAWHRRGYGRASAAVRGGQR